MDKNYGETNTRRHTKCSNYGNVTRSFWQSAIKHTSQHKQWTQEQKLTVCKPANAQLKSSHLQAQLPCSENAEIRQHKWTPFGFNESMCETIEMTKPNGLQNERKEQGETKINS